MTSLYQRPRAFSVHLFLPDGDPDGVKIVEKSNWTGTGLVIPRTLFVETRARPELQRAGVYLLVGPGEQSQLPRLYVGEGDPIGPRLDSHAKNKDFWTHLVAFTSKDQNLNKADVQFLESRLIELARAAKRCTLDNGNTPTAPSLSEADAAEVDGFLADVLLCLPILSYGFFEPAPSPAPSAIEFILSGRGIEARGYESATGFVVRTGSLAAKTHLPLDVHHNTYTRLGNEDPSDRIALCRSCHDLFHAVIATRKLKQSEDRCPIPPRERAIAQDRERREAKRKAKQERRALVAARRQACRST